MMVKNAITHIDGRGNEKINNNNNLSECALRAIILYCLDGWNTIPALQIKSFDPFTAVIEVYALIIESNFFELKLQKIANILLIINGIDFSIYL